MISAGPANCGNFLCRSTYSLMRFKMCCKTMDKSFCFPLLSLPQLPLSVVAKSLEGGDRKSLASVCRSLASLVSAVASHPLVIVRPCTGWQGLCKVLATGTITCWSMLISDNARGKHQPDEDKAVSVLLEPAGVLECQFPGMRRLLIDACCLPSLLSIRLASLLPDLEELELFCEVRQLADCDRLQPIAYCTSLRKLTCWGLPSTYHTSDYLRKQLPNVTSLGMLRSSLPPNDTDHAAMCTMMDAWGDQLVELRLKTRQIAVKQHGNTACNKSVTFLPLSLTSLQLSTFITDLQLQTVLQLPALLHFDTFGFKQNLLHDWSKHPCRWERLVFQYLSTADLAKLPIYSLKGKECIKIQDLALSDALLPDSWLNIMHTAQCVDNSGVIPEKVFSWKYDTCQKHGSTYLLRRVCATAS